MHDRDAGMGARGLGEGKNRWERATLVSVTPNFIRGETDVCDFDFFFIYRGGVRCLLCDFGTYLSVGKCSVAQVLGSGGRENLCMTLVFIYPWSVCF